jgi:hypothetical protein
MACSLETPQLAPHLTPDHTSWPLGHMCHVGAFHGPDGWEVAYHGPGFWTSYGLYGRQDHAEDVAHTMYLAWSTVGQIPVSAMRSLLEFFQPKATA